MQAPKDSLFQLTNEAYRAYFENPPQGADVVRPCTPGDGVERWSAEEVDAWSQRHDADMADRCGLWVPASGAATRMFSFLKSNEEAQRELWASVDQLAFGEAWKESVVAQFGSMEGVQAHEACELLWTNMDQGGRLKGLVPFHVLDNAVENAFDAHVAMWRMLFPERTKMWFTVPRAKHDEVASHLAEVAGEVDWHLPHQNPATDIPVWTREGVWLTDDSGDIVRRPGGHGALLPLLEEVDVPMVVIRNIDNAPSPQARKSRAHWTQAMVAACDAWASERTRLQEELKQDARTPDSVLEWLRAAGAGLSDDTVLSKTEALAWLDRPMRLVGVVRNEGQPGGGPYWVRIHSGVDAGLIRPQIVESIEFQEDQKALMAHATHFNPVDMVCVLRPGQSLAPFVDASRYMMATKEVLGQKVKVLEHPGLWNGGMSGWLTRFVEIPSFCFQPVKSALDLIDRR